MKKLLVFGVIVLFLGISVIPSTGTTDVKQITIPVSSGNILYVGGNGQGNYSSIQDAIDNASDGDTVFVYDDSSPYYENVIMNKSIDLIGEDKNTTIIDSSGSGDAVDISADNVTLSGFTIQNAGRGIRLQRCNGYTLSNNIITSNLFGISSAYCSDNTISENIVSNIENNAISLQDLEDSTISGNIVTNNGGSGISIHSRSYNNLISDNIVVGNDNGIALSEASNNIVSSNIITNNSVDGIYLQFSSGNTISENDIEDTDYYGILVGLSSDNNTLYHNNFKNNTQNAKDGCNNSWDDGYSSGGNYWDDYTGNDSDGDGIGDTPYNISGGDNRDRYPLMEPYGNGDENWTFFGTGGPICPLLNIAEINLIDGNESQIQKIEKILNNRILQFIIPYWWGFINVTELDFTITYNKKIPKIPFWWNFEYVTMLQENENFTFIDKPHTVTVKGLNGTFSIDRGQPFRFRPPYFVFAGFTYDEVTIELIERGRV